MSKAFTKDDAPPAETDLIHKELVSPSENYLTSQGFAHFKKELEALQAEDAVANAERLNHLHRLIDMAHVIIPEQQKSDRVLFGATVKVSDENGHSRIYKLVGVNETNAKAGKISWISPVGSALLQGRVADVVVVTTPHGDEELEIKSVEYKPIPF